MKNKRKWNVLPAIITTAILGFAGVLVETSMNVTFPVLMREFGVNAAVIQWVTTGNLLAVAIIVPLSAYLIRHFSEHQIFLSANLFFITGLIFDALASNLWMLLLGRILQGIGTGVALPLLFHIILHHVPIERRGFITGIATMTTSFAPAIGPTYGGIMLTAFGWKSIFLFLIPILLISTLVGIGSIPHIKITQNGQFNILAFVFLGVGLGSLLLAIEQLSIFWLILCMIAFILFYVSNQKGLLLNLHVFKNKTFVFLMYGVLGFQMISLGLSFILPNHLQIVLGQTSTQAGLFMFPGAILVAILSPISGFIMDRIGAFKPIITGVLITFLGLLMMVIMFIKASVIQLLFLDILIMMGVGIAASNIISTTLSKLSDEEFVDGNSILNTFQQFSGAISTTVVSQIFTLGEMSSVANGAVTGSRNAIFFLIGVVFISLILTLSLKYQNRI